MFYVCTCVIVANQCVLILHYATYKSLDKPTNSFLGLYTLCKCMKYLQSILLIGARHNLLQHNIQLSVVNKQVISVQEYSNRIFVMHAYMHEAANIT
jgi:uncharacterized membrane protein (DUF485 family)